MKFIRNFYICVITIAVKPLNICMLIVYIKLYLLHNYHKRNISFKSQNIITKLTYIKRTFNAFMMIFCLFKLNYGTHTLLMNKHLHFMGLWRCLFLKMELQKHLNSSKVKKKKLCFIDFFVLRSYVEMFTNEKIKQFL